MNGLISLLRQKKALYVGGVLGLILLATIAFWWLVSRRAAPENTDSMRVHKAVINLFLQSEYDSSLTRIQSCRIPLFNSVHRLQNKLVAVGTGTIRKWRTDRDGWVYTTDVQDFGPSGAIGLPNNLTFCLESPSPDYIQTLKVEVNINNDARRTEALQTYAETVEKMIKAVEIKMPTGLKTALLSGKPFELDNDEWTGKSSVKRSGIESWEFAITSH